MRKSRWLIPLWTLLITLIATFPVSARDIFSDWVVSDEPFTAEGMQFVAHYSPTGRIIINTTDDRVLLSKGECREREEIRYCVLDVDHDTHARYENGKEYAGMNIMITLLEPTIQITRAFSTTTPQIQERFNVDGTIKNVGDTQANNLVYSDTFPPWIRITYSTVPLIGNGVRMSLSYLRPGNERPFHYVIAPLDYKEINSEAIVSYDYVGGNNMIKSDPIYLAVQTPISVRQNLSSRTARVNEQVSYTITIENKDPRAEIIVNEFAISIPTDLELLSFSDNLEKQGSSLVFGKSIKKDSKETLSMVLRSRQEGKYTIATLGDFTINSRPIRRDLVQKLTVSSTDVVPVIEIEPSIAQEGDFYRVIATLTNQGEEDILDVDSSISGVKELPLDFNNRAVLKGRTVEIYDVELPVPEVNRSTTTIVRLSGTYNDSEGRRYPFSARENVTFIPAPKIIEMRYDAPASMQRGENWTIIVYAKNLRSEELSGIEIATIVPRRVRIIEDAPYATIRLGPNEEKEAYHFTIQITPTYRQDDVQLKTVANIEIDGELSKATKQISIPLELAPLTTEEEEETEDSLETDGEASNETALLTKETMPETPEGEPEGIFSRLIAWLARLLNEA